MGDWVGQDHWLMGGDFNLIRSLEEKKGGTKTLSGISQAFNMVIEDQHLMDIQTPNGFHTWQNKRAGQRHIVSRLDRFLFSELIMSGEGDIGAYVMPVAGSDHWPICLEWTRLGGFIKRLFRFEKFWTTHPDFKRLISEWWKGFEDTVGS